MEEVRNHKEEHVLPAKRKPDPELVVEAGSEGQDEESSKKAKLENCVAEDKKMGKGSQNDVCCVKYEDEQDEEDDEEDYKGEEEEEEDEEEERSNGEAEAEIDRKGKAIIRSDDKGKGKLVDSSDSDSDSSAFGSDSDTDGESDLSDDPLAEVDLDNILPSRTRRRSVHHHPGVFISNSNSNSNAAGNPKHDGDNNDRSDA